MTQILISSSVLILVLALLRQVLRGKVSFCLQYALWLLVAFRLLLPFQIGHSAYSVTSLSSAQTQAAQSFLERPFTQSAAPLQKQTAPVSPTPAAQRITQPVTRPVLRQTATTMKATKQQMKERVQMIANQPQKWIAALIGLLLVVAITVGCTFAGAKAENPDSPSAPTQESTPTEPENIQPTERAAEQNTPVMEYYSSADGGFRIPQLTVESSDAAFDNARILETFGENETASHFSRVDYTWAQNGAWVSLVVRGTQKDTGKTVRVVSNLNCESGAALTKEALYTSVFDSNRAYEQRLELTLSTYFAKELREILLASPDAKITEFWLSPELAKELQDALLDSPETLPLELVIDAFYETVYYDNMNAAQLWLDENGDLWCCAMVYLPQGGAQEREPCLTGPTGEERYDASVLPRVIELYSAERGHHESDGTPYRLHIPFLLVSGDYANEVNGEILRTFLREDVYSAEYTWAVNGDILSIAVSGESDGKVSRSANIDLRDGTPASQEAG